MKILLQASDAVDVATDVASSAASKVTEDVTGMTAKLQGYFDKGLDATVEYAPKVLIGIAVLWIGWKLANFVGNLLRKALQAKKVDASLIPFLTTLVSTVLKLAIGIAVIDYMGIKTTSFVAILGAAGLAVGMALSGTLQNFAGGVMLLIFRPFNVGDFIVAQDQSGEVQEIQIFQTLIKTLENKSVYIPNGPLSTGSITNFHKEGNVRVAAKVGIAYSADIDKARSVILDMLKGDERLIENDPVVAVTELNESSVDLTIFVWTHPDNYWDVLFETQENVKKAFDREGITIPFPQRDVHIHQAV